MPDGGTVELSAHVEIGRVVVSVRDTGVGMNAELQARVFEPFFTTKATGTGLGLATVLQLTTQYGGRVEIESELSRGTTFRVSFDRIAAPQAPLAEPLPPAAIHASLALPVVPERGRLLLVEDDPLVRRSLTRILSLGGYEVTVVQDGDEALALVTVSPASFACVVTDVAMRRVDGETLATQLSATHPALPMVIISGNREPSLEPMRGAPREFLPKPVLPEELLDAVQRIARAPVS
jgi:CheY-like chemotaxis protein